MLLLPRTICKAFSLESKSRETYTQTDREREREEMTFYVEYSIDQFLMKSIRQSKQNENYASNKMVKYDTHITNIRKYVVLANEIVAKHFAI